MSPPSRRRQHEVNATASPVRVGDGSQPLRQAVIRVLFATTLVALIAGGMAWLHGAHDVPGIFWATATLVAILPAVWWVLAALRRGRVGADIIAVLALVGTPAIHEYLAGALIRVMLATGQALEVAAERRAAKDLRSLLKRAPALRVDGQRGGLQAVPVDEVAIGDVLVVGPGEILPVDAMVASDGAILDESALTGESVHSDYRRVKRCAVGRSMPVGPWRFAPQRRRMGAPTRALCEWLNRPRRKAPPWSASPIASPPGFCR